jgi:enoyl-CoA hydratase/carnithine racemase
MTENVTITLADRLQTIRFTRAAKKNALTVAMYAAITAALARGDAAEEVVAHPSSARAACSAPATTSPSFWKAHAAGR